MTSRASVPKPREGALIACVLQKRDMGVVFRHDITWAEYILGDEFRKKKLVH